MIISPPFLLTRAGNESDQDWIGRCMNGDIPGRGSYPVGDELNWHGGLHLVAPKVTVGQVEPVRAIADGKVIYLRKRTEADSPNEPLNFGDGYTSDACVVIEHRTDIGSGADASGVTYYSLYHHLHAIDASVKLDKPVYRKDVIGQAGHIYGEPNCIHFEICCDDDNLKKLVGRKTGLLSEAAHGRSDVVFGELYFKLPLQTPVYSVKPLPHLIQASVLPAGGSAAHPLPPQALTPSHVMAEPVYIGLRYAGGEGAETQRGSAFLTTYVQRRDAAGQAVPNEFDPLTAANGAAALEDPEAEYKLYERATAISLAYQAAGAPAVPAASAVYELLRFGRVINTAHETLTPADVPNWQRVRYPGGEGWVNLNAGGVKVFSDADFPHWKGWQLIDDDADKGTDSACDSPSIRRWLDGDGDGVVERAERHAQLGVASVQAKLARAICKFPSEWDESTIEQRWAWRKSRNDENPDPLSDEDFVAMTAHVKALCIPCAPLIKAQWRFDPRSFMAIFRKTGWLSNDELTQCLPRKSIAEHHATRTLYRASISIGEAGRRASRISLDLNVMMRKHGLSYWHRAGLFLANAAVESTYFSQFYEGGRGAGHEYGEWYGRGIIQVTHREAYLQYFKYLGRSVANESQNISWRDDLESPGYDCLESAGYWWSRNCANRTCDQPEGNVSWVVRVCENFDWKQKVCVGAVANETRLFNPTLDRVGRHVNTGSPNTTNHMNGLPERRDMYTNIQAVFGDLLYSDAAGSPRSVGFPFFLKRQA
jgi:predicted chitinase